MRKAIVFVVLGIPVLIAVILKIFGQNQFEIPIYYEEGMSSEECEVQSKGQYYVEDIQAKDGNIYRLKDNISLVYFHVDENSSAVQMNRDFKRIFSTKLESGLLNIYALTHFEKDVDNITDVPGKTVMQIEIEQIEKLARCSLFIPNEEHNEQGIAYNFAVLIDMSGRIRGYYNGSDEKEIDRLSAEVDILELEYNNGQ